MSLRPANRPLRTFSRTTAPANLYFRKSREIHHVPELSTVSESSYRAIEVDDSHLEVSDLFDLYEDMHVPCPETRISDNSGDEPTAEPAPPNHVDTTVSQPFGRWMSTLRRREVAYGNLSSIVLSRRWQHGWDDTVKSLARFHTQDVRVDNLFHWDEDCPWTFWRRSGGCFHRPGI